MIVPSRMVCGWIEPWGSAVYSPTWTLALRGTRRAGSLRDQAADVVLRHPGSRALVDGLVDFQRRLRREAHQLDLVRVLDHPAAGRDRRRADDLQLRRGAGDAVGEHELDGLLDAEPAGGDAAILQSLRDAHERALVFLPGADVGCAAAERAERDLLARAIFLEGRADEERFALDRDDHGKQPLAAAPADVREVRQRGAAGQHDARRSSTRAISRRALSIRARRSSLVIGRAWSRIDVSAAIDGGSDRLGRSRGRHAAARRAGTRRAPDNASRRARDQGTDGD